MEKIIWLIVLGVVASIAKAIQDKLQFHFEKSVFKNLGSWWNPKLSHRNKYTWFPKSKVLTWLISNPLVAITDAWHCFGLIRDFSTLALIPAILLNSWWIIVLYAFFRLVFHLVFTYLLKTNKK